MMYFAQKGRSLWKWTLHMFIYYYAADDRYIFSLQSLSISFLNTFTDGAAIALAGSPFQALIVHCENEYSLAVL